MLNKFAFANSLALVSIAAYIFFLALKIISPAAFEFLANAQFGGANIAVLFPREMPVQTLIGTFISMMASVWIMGFIWAFTYNKLNRQW